MKSEAPFQLQKDSNSDYVIAMAGNPNVGKSTVFNALTGLRQHTGNWAGKTVTCAQGSYFYEEHRYICVDLPGTYSLLAHSPEEEAARDFIVTGGADVVVVVCDATCLERNLILVLQILALTPQVIVCVNLLDEAKKKNIRVDLEKLEAELKVPVIPSIATSKQGLAKLKAAVHTLCTSMDSIQLENAALGISQTTIDDQLLSREETALSFITRAELLAKAVVFKGESKVSGKEALFDRLVTGPWTSVPLMLLLLMGIFWLTITGANYPSALITGLLFGLQDKLLLLFEQWGVSVWLTHALILGVYRTVAWVVSVMLPPMAIFFPLFTLLEDFGYLPRVAFNLDGYFKKCGACGKQALTMCMGLGCNAAGVIGCRIIDSRRERLLAILTNSLMPCNGRFPLLISLITMFLLSGFGGAFQALSLTVVILLSVLATLLVCHLLSATLLKGNSSSFTLELPPYRRPQIGKLIMRSILDRTLFVLGRAIIVAAPAGLLIWILANVTVSGNTLLFYLVGFLNPFGRLLGLDGAILVGFLLGFPANEIVIPITLMCYLSTGSLTDIGNLAQLRQVLVFNGWTWVTAVCVILFSLFHWPCSTTCLTIKKETGSIKWMLLSILIPTAIGITLCFLTAAVARIFFA